MLGLTGTDSVGWWLLVCGNTENSFPKVENQYFERQSAFFFADPDCRTGLVGF